MKFAPDLTTCFLKPGEWIFVRRPSLIRTILGSCVTVTMLHRRTGAAAACHPVLPGCREAGACPADSCPERFKYVDCVIPRMIRRFARAGAGLGELEIKLFGGAHMFEDRPGAGPARHVGTINVEMAQQIIRQLNAGLRSFDVGGTHGRKIIFHTGTGDVWVRKFRPETGNTTAGRLSSRPRNQQGKHGKDDPGAHRR